MYPWDGIYVKCSKMGSEDLNQRLIMSKVTRNSVDGVSNLFNDNI